MTRSLVINTASHAVPIRREFRMADLTDRFGTMVFSEEVMKDYLPKDIWKRLAATLEGGEPLDLDVANAVAHAMRSGPSPRVRRTTHTGSSRFRALLPRSTTASWSPTTTAPLLPSLRARTSSRASRTPPASPTAACAPPSRPVATPLGIPPAPLLSRTMSCASPRLSAPTRARPWTRRPRCCAP